ncbi:MAG: hypothetical protein M3Y59_10805 [Myxococcota bacterium]|nr:hypothetical protein [Myxococcota bacterium]
MPGYSVGLPRLHKEAGERRDFLPPLIEFLDRVGAESILIEEGYGSGMGIPLSDYLAASPRCRVGTLAECYAQQVVVALRCPDEALLRTLKPGTTLLSMLHFPTRPARVKLLADLGLHAVSLDSVKDDLGNRLVQNMASVGWNGIRASFGELAKTLRDFSEPRRRPIRVTVLGSGAVGGHAAHAAIRYGDPALRSRLTRQGVPGVEVTMIDYELTGDERYMLTRLEHTDLLVDATQRPDPSRVVIPNDWVAALPQHAVVLDLAVDPYALDGNPPSTKGIEGVPEGNLDRYVFGPQDPAYDALDPRVRHHHRRTALSCYSWPGVEPKPCMEVYGAQIEPVLRALVATGVENLDPDKGPFYERATARAELKHWRKTH